MDTSIIPQNCDCTKGQKHPSLAWRQESKAGDQMYNYIARLALARLHMYPSQPMENRPDLHRFEYDLRARLHHIADTLPLTDLWGLYHLGRVLLNTTPPPEIFEYVQNQNEIDVSAYNSRGQ